MCTRVCKKCNLEKDILEYTKLYSNKEWRRSVCRWCLGYKGLIPKTKEEKLQQRRESRLKRRDIELIQRKEYYLKKKKDPIFALTKRLRNRIYNILRKDKCRHTIDIVGCSKEEFKIHIESQFKDGMSWERLNEIHIDHIIPVSSATTKEEVYKLNHYTNLQPLWAKDNLRKHNKFI